MEVFIELVNGLVVTVLPIQVSTLITTKRSLRLLSVPPRTTTNALKLWIVSKKDGVACQCQHVVRSSDRSARN